MYICFDSAWSSYSQCEDLVVWALWVDRDPIAELSFGEHSKNT